jgi:hypothetical protein
MAKKPKPASGRTRLRRLAALLHDNSRGHQMTIPGDGTPKFVLGYKWVEKNDCGTVACAAGCAMLSPWFQQQGLKTLDSDGTAIPMFMGVRNFAALQKFFGVDSETALRFFYPNRYRGTPSPKYVANRIRQYLDGKPMTGIPKEYE